MGHCFFDIQYDKINFSLTSLKKIKLQFNFNHYFFPLFEGYDGFYAYIFV